MIETGDQRQVHSHVDYITQESEWILQFTGYLGDDQTSLRTLECNHLIITNNNHIAFYKEVIIRDDEPLSFYTLYSL